MNAGTLAAEHSEAWSAVLIIALAASGALVLGYRLYRLTKGGPMADVWGGVVQAALLAFIAGLVAADVAWARWPAFVYALLFALVVMPIWTLAILLPMRPGVADYLFTTVYWSTLLVIAVAAVAA